jgi:UDP-N-acetylglucosamine 3-dehydrogenase
MGSLRVGLIGLGVMGRHHLRVLSSLDGVNLVGLYDPYSQEKSSLSSSLIAQNLDDLLSRRLDYCVVAAPTALHAEIGSQLARARIHALIEKPLASSAEEAKALVNDFESAGVIGGVGHIERYNPALQEAKKRISGGQLGTLHQIATRRQGPYPARIMDVGVVKDLATHDIDLSSWIVGHPFTKVAAVTSNKSGHIHEDFVAAIGHLSDGTITNHLVNWLSPIKERTVVITGENGAFVADTLNSDLTYYSNGAVDVIRDDIATFRGVREGDVIRYAFPKPEPLRLEHENFRDAILGTQNEIVTMRQGLETVRVAEAILVSSQSGKVVELTEVFT